MFCGQCGNNLNKKQVATAGQSRKALPYQDIDTRKIMIRIFAVGLILGGVALTFWGMNWGMNRLTEKNIENRERRNRASELSERTDYSHESAQSVSDLGVRLRQGVTDGTITQQDARNQILREAHAVRNNESLTDDQREAFLDLLAAHTNLIGDILERGWSRDNRRDFANVGLNDIRKKSAIW
jgi:hypothetical protein